MNLKEEKIQLLEDLIIEIQSLSHNCKWFISSDKVAEILDIAKEDFHRLIYSCRTEFNNYHGGFNESDGDVLCRILEKALQLNNISDRFYQAGIYINNNILEYARDYYITFLNSWLNKHEMDKELLLLLVSSTKTFADAYDSYIDEKFDLEFFLRRCVDEFTESYSIDTGFGAEVFLREYLQNLLMQNRINIKKVTSKHRDKLYFELFGQKYQYNDAYEKKKLTKSKKKNRINNLLEFFSLKEGCTSNDVKKRYKEMLKEYHPDINKEGLELTQKIIANYKELIEHI